MGVGEGPMPSHDKVPNLKLVMNPEGKLHDWPDLPADEVPGMAQVAAGTGNPEAAHAMVENLQACKGRGGELFAKRRKKAEQFRQEQQETFQQQQLAKQQQGLAMRQERSTM